MFKTLKKYFIPHKENDHKPHILRNEATLALLCILFVIELIYLTGAGFNTNYNSFFAKIISGVLVDETNYNRISLNLSSLIINPILAKAAQEKAQDMAKNGYFSHVGPDGKTPWRWLSEAGYNYSYAGENLAVNFNDSKDVVDAWMNSPGHRANILNGNYTEIGIGTATGTYKGRETVFIAQYFGKPLALINPNPNSNAPITENTSIKTVANKTKVLPKSSSSEIAGINNKDVLGESLNLTPTSSPEEQSFVAIVNPDVSINVETNATNAGSSIPVRYSSVLDKSFTSPRSMVSRVLILFAIIITLALALMIFIKIEIQHPPLILNGLLLIVLIVSALIINKYIGLLTSQIL